MGNIAVQLQLDGTASVLLFEIGVQQLLYKGCSDGRNTVQAGGLVQGQPVQCRLLPEVQFAGETPV